MNWYLGLKGNTPVGWTNEPKEGYIEVSQAVRDIHEAHPDYVWNGTTLVPPPVPSFSAPDPIAIEKQRVARLWQSAHDYEYAEISGSAVGLLAMGVMQGKPKCIAVQNWIKGIWTTYYERKFGTSTDYDFSVCGTCPYSVPELMMELGL